jgi:hypothetical protein
MQPTMPIHPRMKQRGQALIWFLATLAASCMALALVYNMGQLANEKEKTVNAADASALSGALVEARILNFTAYTNRAMIANEVTVAQLVSADSFIRYDTTMAQYLDEYLQPLAFIPVVDVVVGVLDGYADAMQEVVKPAVDDAVTGGIQLCDFTITILKAAREMAVLTAPIAASDVASGVAEANQTTNQSLAVRFDTQPELNPTMRAAMLAVNTGNWTQFIDYKEGSARGDSAEVITHSLDPFSVRRGNGGLISLVNTALLSTWLTGWNINFQKTSGSTQLVDFDHWASQDSLDPVLTTVSICWTGGFIPLPYICFPSNYVGVPIGYGRADADNNDSTSDNLCQPALPAPGGVTVNCGLAQTTAPSPFSSNGIPNIFDVANPGGPNTPDPTLTFVAGVQKNADAALTTPSSQMELDTTHIDGPQGSPDLTNNVQNNNLTSIASAKVFYARPDWNPRDITRASLPRPDRRHEYASLYNPYWQARLTPTDDATKAGFYLLTGVDPSLSVVTP